MNSELNDIKKLLERYLKGETSIEEEDRLNAFFHQLDVPDELMPYRQMFDIATQPNITPDDLTLQTFAENNGIRSKRHSVMLPLFFRIASAVAAAILIFMAGYHFNDRDIQQPTVKEKIVKVTNIVRDTVREKIPIIIHQTVNRKVYIAVTPKRHSDDAKVINANECDMASINPDHSAATVSRTLLSGTTLDINAEFNECAKAQTQFENKEMKNFIKTLGYEANK
jgi:hypothetical protein